MTKRFLSTCSYLPNSVRNTSIITYLILLLDIDLLRQRLLIQSNYYSRVVSGYDWIFTFLIFFLYIHTHYSSHSLLTHANMTSKYQEDTTSPLPRTHPQTILNRLRIASCRDTSIHNKLCLIDILEWYSCFQLRTISFFYTAFLNLGYGALELSYIIFFSFSSTQLARVNVSFLLSCLCKFINHIYIQRINNSSVDVSYWQFRCTRQGERIDKSIVIIIRYQIYTRRDNP